MSTKSQKTISHYIPDFLEWLEIEKGLAPKSQKNYHRFLKKFLAWLRERDQGDLKPHQLTPELIWKYRVFLARKKSPKTNRVLKRSTQNCYLVGLRSLLTFFVARNIKSLAPEKVKLPKEDKDQRKIHFLDLEQIKKLLDQPDTSTKTGLRDRAILETLFSTGLRVAELVNLDRDQIKIKEDTEELEVGIVGKGDRPRTVYFSKRALGWLEKYLKTREDEEQALFVNYRGPNPLTRLTPRSVDRTVKKYVIEAGLPSHTTPHTIRHSFATDLLMKGVDLRTVQEFLGHKNIATTQVYTHITKKHLREVHKEFHSGEELE